GECTHPSRSHVPVGTVEWTTTRRARCCSAYLCTMSTKPGCQGIHTSRTSASSSTGSMSLSWVGWERESTAATAVPTSPAPTTKCLTTPPQHAHREGRNPPVGATGTPPQERSEERRVGKEGRSAEGQKP